MTGGWFIAGAPLALGDPTKTVAERDFLGNALEAGSKTS